MALKLPNAARSGTLTAMIAGFLGNSALVHLLGTRVIEADTVTLATLMANESSFTGYVATPLGNWSTPTVATGQPAAAQSHATFNVGGMSLTPAVFGYFLTDPGSIRLYGMEDFGATATVLTSGEPFVLFVNYQLATM